MLLLFEVGRKLYLKWMQQQSIEHTENELSECHNHFVWKPNQKRIKWKPKTKEVERWASAFILIHLKVMPFKCCDLKHHQQQQQKYDNIKEWRLTDWLTDYCRIDSNQKQMNEYLCLNFNLIRKKISNQKQFMPYAAVTILLLFTILWVMKSLRNRFEWNRLHTKFQPCLYYRAGKTE